MSTRVMRLSEALREAHRNLVTGTSHGVLFMLLVAVIACALSALDATTMTQIVTGADQFRARGASISILTAEGSIDGRACDALADQAGVRAAGALSERSAPLTVAGIPQNPLTFFTATPGFATMLPNSTGQQAAGLLLPDTLADTLGLTVGDAIYSRDGQTVLGGTYRYPDDGRPRGMGYAAIAPASPDTLFDQCWIDAYPVSKATTELLYTAIAANSSLPDSGPTLTQHNTSLGRAIDPGTAFTTRMSALAPVAALLLGIILGLFAIGSRRLEIASALHTGVRRLDQATTLLAEVIAWSVTGAATAIPVIAALTQHLAEGDRLPVVLTALQTPAMTVAGVILGSAIAVLGIREARLFTYFKNR